MSPRVLSEADSARHTILWDGGVLSDGAVLELGDWSGGDWLCALPLRSTALRAREAGARVVESMDELEAGHFTQCVVHLQKSRAATLRDVCDALGLLADDGELLVIGYNDLGIKSLVTQLEKLLGAAARIRANRKRGRVAAFSRSACTVPTPPADTEFEVAAPVAQRLHVRPGVFSADRLDPGSALLLAHLRAAGDPTPPSRILDLGCGAGTLGLQAAALWPDATALLLDADLRAVHCARDNAERLGMQPRVAVRWWDASERVPRDAGGAVFDLVLINPPFHVGKQVDMGPAIAMFDHAAEALSPNGAALIVANRTLPYEPTLRGLGSLEVVEQARGFKLMRLTRAVGG